MRWVALVLVGSTSLVQAAPPEMALGDQQLELEAWPAPPDLDTLFDEPGPGTPPRPAWARFAGFAQLTGGGRAYGDVGAGAAVALGGAGCELAAATVHGRFRPFAEDGEPLGRVTYSLCPIAFGLTLKFDGHRGTGIMPALDARRSLWNRTYTDAYDRLEFAAGPFWNEVGKPTHTIFAFGLGHGTTTQTDDFETRTTKTLDLDLVLYRLDVAGFGLDAIALTSSALKAGTTNQGGVASHFVPVRLRYETPLVFARAAAGWGFTGGQITASGKTEVDGKTVSEWEETIDSEGLPDVTQWVGDVEAGIRGDRLQASARAARGFFPTFDGNIARESRVSANLTWTPGRTRRTLVSIAPFATRTRTWNRDAPSALEVGAGAQLHVGREINEKLRVDAIGEAGVSPYARSETERLPAAKLGGQILVAISGRVTDLHRHLRR